MEEPIEYYSFQDSYEKEWREFIAQFPLGNDPKEGAEAAEVREWCVDLHDYVLTLINDTPEYSTQMEIYFHWKGLERKLKEGNNPWVERALQWFASLLVKMMVCDHSEINESLWYAIGVNYFECGMDGFWLLPLMFDQVPHSERDGLIEKTLSIDWAGKVDTYKRVAATNQHQEALLSAIYHSCHAYCFEAAKASEALEILNQLNTENVFLANETRKVLSNPVEVQVMDHVQLEQRSESGVCCFLAIEREEGFIPTWFPFAELWVDGEFVQSLEDSYFGLSWENVARDHGFEAPEGIGKIIGLKNPWDGNWSSKKVALKPI